MEQRLIKRHIIDICKKVVQKNERLWNEVSVVKESLNNGVKIYKVRKEKTLARRILEANNITLDDIV